MGAALREGLAGAASGLTFGLVSQETISGGLQAIGNAAGSVADGIAGLFKSDAEKEQDKLKAKQEQLDKEMEKYENASLLERQIMDEKMNMQSEGRFKTHAAYLASLQMQTDDQLAEIEKQRVESGDASKGFLGSLGQGMKNYYSFLGGLVPDGVKDIGKSVLSFGKNLFGMGDDEEEEKKTVSNPEREELAETVRVTEGLSESSTALADRADIEKKRNSIVPGGLFEISKLDENKLDVYEDYPILYKKIYFDYYNSKVMTYTMVSKSEFRYPTERYLNVVKRGYRDCKLDKKYLLKALINH